MRGLRVVAICASAVALVSCVVGPTDDSSAPAPQPIEKIRYDADALAPGGRWIATATAPVVDVFADPRQVEPVHRLAHPDANGTPLVFLVETDDAEGEWLPVSVPVRPNGSRGWIRSHDVALTQTQYRIKVDLGANTLTIHEGRELRLTTPVGVCKESTPTPPGRYYVKELIQPPNPTQFLPLGTPVEIVESSPARSQATARREV